jgi:hypothetical protein
MKKSLLLVKQKRYRTATKMAEKSQRLNKNEVNKATIKADNKRRINKTF